MASKNISFDNIPGSIRKPGKYFEFNTKLAVRTLPQNAQNVCIIAQRIAAGSVAECIPTQVFSDAEAADYFGEGSIAHLMARAAIKAYPYLQLSVCALDDSGTGVPRVETLTLTGPATASGSITLYVGNVAIEIGITSADTAIEIATAIKAELDANYPDLPFSVVQGASPSDHILTFTAINDGTCANEVDFNVEYTATGITAVWAETTSGAVDPDIDDALDACFASDYTIYIVPFIDSTAIGKLKDHLDSISGPMEQRPAIGVFGYDGVLATISTLCGTTINSGRITCGYLRGTHSPAYEIAAAYGAVLASEEDPARPLNTLALKKIHAPEIADRLSRTEQESLLYNGVTPLEVGPGETVQIVRAISTYTVDAQGIDDVSLLDITTIRTLDYVRKALRTRIALRFPREKLSSKTPEAVRDQILDVLYMLQDLEIVEEVEANEDGVICERDLQDVNRLDAKVPTDIVNGLHVFATRIDLLL